MSYTTFRVYEEENKVSHFVSSRWASEYFLSQTSYTMGFKDKYEILHSVNSSWDSELPGSWHCLMYIWPFEVVEILYVYIMLSCDIFKAFDIIIQLASHEKLFVFMFLSFQVIQNI